MGNAINTVKNGFEDVDHYIAVGTLTIFFLPIFMNEE